MKTRIAVLVLPILGLTACMEPEGPTLASPSVDPQLLPQRDVYFIGSLSGMDTKRGRLILDQNSLRAAWDTMFANVSPDQRPAVPDIDFGASAVLLAAAGSTPTQLLSFRIVGVRGLTHRFEALVESQWPKCGGSPVVTTPVHVVMVPRVATEATFEFVDLSTPCS